MPPGGAPAATRPRVRVSETLASKATPSAAPSWIDVLARPEASPVSAGAASCMARATEGEKARPAPAPKSTIPGKHVDQVGSRERQEHEEHQATENQEQPRNQGVAGPEAVHRPGRDEQREQGDQQVHRQEGEAGRDRTVPEDVLEVEGADEEVAEHPDREQEADDRGRRWCCGSEHPEGHHRMVEAGSSQTKRPDEHEGDRADSDGVHA